MRRHVSEISRWGGEVAGTAVLVFIGVGAEMLNRADGVLGGLGVAAAFGIAVALAVWLTVSLSGAHLNPAVTFGLWLAGRFPGRRVLPYWSAQVAGAVVASGLLAALSGQAPPVTRPSAGIWPAVATELVLTLLLMLVVLRLPHRHPVRAWRIAVPVGLTVAFAAAVGGGVSGASMNPARSLGPACMAGDFGSLWIYLTAPFWGAAFAVMTCRRTRPQKCCPGLAWSCAAGEKP